MAECHVDRIKGTGWSENKRESARIGLAEWYVSKRGEGMTYRFGDKRELRSMKSAIKVVVPGLPLWHG